MLSFLARSRITTTSPSLTPARSSLPAFCYLLWPFGLIFSSATILFPVVLSRDVVDYTHYLSRLAIPQDRWIQKIDTDSPFTALALASSN